MARQPMTCNVHANNMQKRLEWMSDDTSSTVCIGSAGKLHWALVMCGYCDATASSNLELRSELFNPACSYSVHTCTESCVVYCCGPIEIRWNDRRRRPYCLSAYTHSSSHVTHCKHGPALPTAARPAPRGRLTSQRISMSTTVDLRSLLPCALHDRLLNCYMLHVPSLKM